MIHSQPFVDKLPIELTVLVGLFESICNFNDLCGVNQVDSSVSTNLTRMILGMETIFLDLLSLSSLDKLCPDNSRIGCVDCGCFGGGYDTGSGSGGGHGASVG